MTGARRRRREHSDTRSGGYLSHLRDALETRGLRLTKRLGQHLLIDPNLNRRIAETGAGGSPVVLEIGPGAGSLTAPLLDTGATVVAVEIDAGLAAFLAERFAGRRELVLVHADALDGPRVSPAACDGIARALRERSCDRFRVVSNLPYSIASTFLIALAASDLAWSGGAVVLQREVGERLAAGAGEREYGAASVVWQTLASGRVERTIPREVFWPMPDVASALFEIAPRADVAADLRRDAPKLGEFVKALFSQRRKVVRSALVHACSACGVPSGRDVVDAAAARAGIDATARIERVSPGQIVGVWRDLTGPGGGFRPLA